MKTTGIHAIRRGTPGRPSLRSWPLAAVLADSCQGCFMQLPPQLVHVLRGGRKVVKCPSCARLLYMAQ